MLGEITKAFNAQKAKAKENEFILESTLDVEEVIPGSEEELDDIIDSDSIPDDVMAKVDAALDKLIGDGIDDEEIEEMIDDDDDSVDAELDVVLGEAAGKYWYDDEDIHHPDTKRRDKTQEQPEFDEKTSVVDESANGAIEGADVPEIDNDKDKLPEINDGKDKLPKAEEPGSVDPEKADGPDNKEDPSCPLADPAHVTDVKDDEVKDPKPDEVDPSDPEKMGGEKDSEHIPSSKADEPVSENANKVEFLRNLLEAAGVINEGEQAEAYKKKKAAEKEAAEEGDSRYESDHWDRPGGKRQKYDANGLDLEDKASAAEYAKNHKEFKNLVDGSTKVNKELSNRIDKMYNSKDDAEYEKNKKNAENVGKYSHQAADAAARHARRHPQNEDTTELAMDEATSALIIENMLDI